MIVQSKLIIHYYTLLQQNYILFYIMYNYVINFKKHLLNKKSMIKDFINNYLYLYV